MALKKGNGLEQVLDIAMTPVVSLDLGYRSYPSLSDGRIFQHVITGPTDIPSPKGGGGGDIKTQEQNYKTSKTGRKAMRVSSHLAPVI
jgi:hypothetical protein